MTVGITSSGSGVGSAVLRALTLSHLGCRIICLDCAADSCGPHRGHQGRLLPRALDPGYAEAVLTTCAQEGIQALIPGLDTELEPLARIAGPLRAVGCELLCSAPEVIVLLRNKLACYEYFTKLGLPFVPTLPLARVEEIIDRHGFPIVVKPQGGSASRGVHVLFDREELDALTGPGGPGAGEPLIVQPYLVPLAWSTDRARLRREDVYSNFSLVQRDEHMIQVLVGRDGRPFGTMTSRNSLKDGAISRMLPWADDPTGATGQALAMARHLAGMGLVGPCNFQSRVTAEGPFFYEINPRFSGGTGGRAMLGFNEVEACLRQLVLGEGKEAVDACLQTRFGEVCAWHPAEVLMSIENIDQLRQGHTIRPLVMDGFASSRVPARE